jgi:flavodoxin
MRFDLVYFSWTGKTREVFDCLYGELKKRGFSVSLREIVPKRDYPYAIWLLLSFIPNFSVEISPVEISSKVVFLGMPKWSLNCPPITAFMKKAELKGRSFFLVITYGGFDEERYARSMARRIESWGGEVKGVLLVKRRDIESKEYKRIVQNFVEGIDFYQFY